MSSEKPSVGEKIRINKENETLIVPDNPIIPFTEGAFRDWGYELAKDEFPNEAITEDDLWDKHNGKKPAGKVGMLRDRPVFIGIATGGVFTGDQANQPDFLTPYLSVAQGSIGLKTLQFLPVQATGFIDRDQATLAREKAIAAIDLTIMAFGAERPNPGARVLDDFETNDRGEKAS